MKKILLPLLLLGTLNQGAFAEEPSKNAKPDKEKAEVSQERAVKIEDIKVGTGSGIHAGQRITVHYTGTLENGTVFDCSRKRGQAFEFVYGVGQVIPGWEQGLKTMKIGGQRRITIPPELAYGDAAVGNIPANSTLIFDVELMSAK